MRGKVELLRVDSEALRGNRLGDPHVREVPVYVPPGGGRFPVIFCLAGYTGGGRSWLNWSAWGETLVERFERLLDGGARPAILVMPDCFTRLGGSQYVNSPAIGRYEDHVLELVREVDARFPSSGVRGVMGKSSGGYGALVLAMRHPQIFSAAASHAGDMYFEWCYKGELPALALAVMRAGGVEQFLAATLAKHRKDVPNLSTLCACAAYLGDESGIRVPFDPQTGELDERLWREFCTHDPVELVTQHAEALRSLRLLFIDAGLRDEHYLQLGARVLAKRLRALGVPCTHEEFDDGHRDTAYRYDVSLPLLSGVLS